MEINRKNIHDSKKYQRTQMQKEIILQRLKNQGFRITKQRRMLLDIILEEECSSCKEIYYKASRLDHKIGSATVYRMVNTLEDIGAISRKNMYRVACGDACNVAHACTIELNDDTVYQLNAKHWNKVIREGLKACGYLDRQDIRSVTVQPCSCEEV
ncbi:MAG: transcriptional repressor [Clostridiaceae bacterium]|nr:transcriptional repressor [Clostridiaceae bacterium]